MTVPEGIISGKMRVGRSSCWSISKAHVRRLGSYIWLVVAMENSLLRSPVNR